MLAAVLCFSPAAAAPACEEAETDDDVRLDMPLLDALHASREFDDITVLEWTNEPGGAAILTAQYLDERLSALTDLVWPHLSEADRQRVENNEGPMRQFIQQRTQWVEAELATLP